MATEQKLLVKYSNDFEYYFTRKKRTFFEVIIPLTSSGIFSGSIMENLLWGDENASEEEVKKQRETKFSKDITISILVPLDSKEKVEKDITEQTSGSAALEWKDEVTYGLINKQVKLF